MSIRPFRDIKRKKTKKIKVGKINVGGGAPISVQSMTNTLTTNVEGTVKQINELTEAGADIVRVSCPDKDSSLSLKKIINQVNVPIVADIHFHYKRAIEAANSGADCLRINPGNIGSKEKIREILKAAKDNNCSIRVGINAGSLEKKLLEKYKEPRLKFKELMANPQLVSLELNKGAKKAKKIADAVMKKVRKNIGLV